MSGFSESLRKEVREEQKHKCFVLDIEVDNLEGHHAVPKSLGGSNHRVNLEMVCGEDSYSVYGIKMDDVHEKLDRLAIDEGIYLHPITKELVTRDKMPVECFRSPNLIDLPKVRKSNKENKKHKRKNNR